MEIASLYSSDDADLAHPPQLNEQQESSTCKMSDNSASSGALTLADDAARLLRELQGFLVSLHFGSTDGIATSGTSTDGPGTKITSFAAAGHQDQPRRPGEHD